jgi:NAD(P)-dependent dehydrogenase (short-subunit alcohol dehydrogenase family)
MTTKKWGTDDLPQLHGRTVIVTGATSGLGTSTARALADAGARVVMAVRDVGKGTAVAATMPGTVEVRALDLTSLASVRAFADGWTGALDILVNNAGVMYAPKGRTADGFELHIGTNHLGHFALTNLLLPHITDRVVTVTSGLAARGKIDLDDLNWDRRPYNASQAYADSKQANILFTAELERRAVAAGSSMRAISAHPGIAKTSLISHARGVSQTMSRCFVKIVGQSVDQGCLETLFAATQDIPGNSFVVPDGPGHMRGYPLFAVPPKGAQSRELAVSLWSLSSQLTNTGSSVPTSA